MKDPLQRPMENIIRGLDEHSEHLSPAEVHDELKACGVDIEKTLARADTFISHSLKQERTAWMRVADVNRAALESVSTGFVSWIERGESEILAAFEALKTGLTDRQALAFRNQKDLSVVEKAQILDEFEKVRQPKDAPQG